MGVFLLMISVIAGGAGWADVQAQPSAKPQASSNVAPPRIAIQETTKVRRADEAPAAIAVPVPFVAPGAIPIPLTADANGKANPPVRRRFKIRDDYGHCVVGRLHGQHGDKTTLILPDGQLGYPNMLVPTDQPFQPLTAAELAARIQTGPFAGFQLLKTAHYVVLYQSSRAFAEDSGRLLEDLYRGLIDAFHRNEIPVHESEFPLVAVIFATEQDFRAHKKVDPQVQAYYEFFTNRIFFYQKSDRDHVEPKLAALLKPQTVAHEGAHQILSNIGVQPRLSQWPLWLVEGLAEYCATTASTKKGAAWLGLGTINALHMATIRELDDPLSTQVSGPDSHAARFASQRCATHTESLILETDLTPTDYALAWAMTHYLARKRGPEFVSYLRNMGQLPPMQPRTPDQHLAEFRKFFGDDLSKLDKKIDEYVRKLSNKKGYDPLPYYAVMFEQALNNGMINRAVMVSQSPQIIQQWVHDRTSPHGDVPNWEAIPLPTRARADVTAMQWMRGD